MKETKIGFSYGPSMPTLESQANKQGFTLGKDGEKLEKIRQAINMCGFHVATNSQINTMIVKLHKKVTESLMPLKNEEEANV